MVFIATSYYNWRYYYIQSNVKLRYKTIFYSGLRIWCSVGQINTTNKQIAYLKTNAINWNSHIFLASCTKFESQTAVR